MNSLKINQLINKYADPALYISGFFTLAGIIFHHFVSVPVLVFPCFLLGTIFAGFPIAFRAYTGLKYKTIGIEVLVTIAVCGAFVIREYSEAAIVTFLFQFGKKLESVTMKKTRSAIRELIEMSAKTAFRICDDEIEEVDIDELEEGDLILVKTGGQIPVDGVIEKGEGHINEASVTGESVSRKKTVGDHVYAGSIMDQGTVEIKAIKVGDDTTFAKIIELVEEAQDAKSEPERLIDRFAKYYTPSVIVMAFAVLLFTKNVETAITVLVLACPGALVIGAPIANVAGIGKGAKEGILLKGGDSVHTFAKTDLFVFDKTGTLTIGHPVVSAYYGDDMMIPYAAALESISEHPLSKAIKEYAGTDVPKIEQAEVCKGFGVKGIVEGHRCVVGNARFMKNESIEITEEIRKKIDEQIIGSLVLIAKDEVVRGLFIIKDTVRDDAKEMLAFLRDHGAKKIVMLSGDNEVTAEAVGKEIGMDEIHAGLLPHEKLAYIKEAQLEGYTVTFVGDGVNDSPAIVASDTGIAIGTGTDAAIECSDVVLIRSQLKTLAEAFVLSKRVTGIMYQNIWIAIGTVIFLLLGLLNGYIHMASGMFVHEGSILAVILNAMRLLIGRRIS